ncbi:MAG: hypothetical protein DWQ04_09845, partial [Chloroflexi bacterium]
TPLNPGHEHSYASVLQVLTHELTHLVVDEITNEVLPACLDEGIALYEARQMPSSEFIAAQAAQNMPSIDALDFNVGTDTGIIYAFSYTLIEFVSREFGNDYMIEIAKTNGDFEKVFNMTELEFEQAWQAFVMAEYATPGQKSCTDNNCSAN